MTDPEQEKLERKAWNRALGRCECSGQCGLPHPHAIAGRRCAVPHGVRIIRHHKHPVFWYALRDASFRVPVDRSMFRAAGRQELKPVQTRAETLILCKLCRSQIRKGKTSNRAGKPTPSAEMTSDAS